MVLGSVEWLILQRSGVFDRRPPVPKEPGCKPMKMPWEIAEISARPKADPLRRKKRRRKLVAPLPKGRACAYCERLLIPNTSTHPTRDHVIPKSKGGRATVWCCTKCNNAKGDMMPDEWQRFMHEFPEWWMVPGREAAGRRAILATRKTPDGAALMAVPKAFDDPKAQAAFEAVYATRLHLLRADPVV